MPSPLLNEQAILDELKSKIALDNYDNARLGAMLGTIDCRDRKVEREHFVDMVNSGYNLTNLIGRLYAYNYVKQLKEEGKLDDWKHLDSIIETLTVSAEAFRSKMHRLMEQVAQCPYDEDSKH